MRHLTLFFILLISGLAFAQKKPEDFGYIHKTYQYKNTTVDVLIKCKPGEEKIKKPLFFLCQGSLPMPLIKYDEQGLYNVFPFKDELLYSDYHMVILGKPGIPVMAEIKDLDNFKYMENGKFPPAYTANNHPDYYTERNNYILKQLLKEDFADSKKLVVAGHSEGSHVAARMAASNKKVTHLIYSGGNPYGRIASIVQQDRYNGQDDIMQYWKDVVANKDDMHGDTSDTNKATYDFSIPTAPLLLKLTIPVMIVYGLKDWSAPHNDLLQIEAIRNKKTNFTFKAYPGLEHNFYPVDEKMNPDYNVYNWDNVGTEWANWLKS